MKIKSLPNSNATNLRGLFLLVIVAMIGLPHHASENATAQNIDWKSDLEFLAQELPARHIDLFANIDQATFETKVNQLSQNIGDTKSNSATMELMKLIASVGDGHTSTFPDQANLHYYRVNVRWFEDGIFVRAIDHRHQELVGAKLTGVGGLKTEEIVKGFTELFSHDNEWGVYKTIDKQFPTFEFLEHLGATNSDGTATFHFEKGKKKKSITLEAVSGADFQKVKIVNSYALGMMKPSVYLDLMIKDERGLPFWNEYLPKKKTLYFKYNQCRDPEGFKKLVNGTAGFIKQYDVEKFVLDLRDNSGGSSLVFKPLLDYLLNNEEFNQTGKLFVLVGRDTFSSGMFAAVDMRQTNAIFVGEPTGCKPNHFGEVQTFQLPSSGLTVQYSTKSFQLSEADEATFEPDVRITYKAKEFLKAFDPALDAVFKYKASDQN